MFARETLAGVPLLFNKTRRRRAICAANRRGTNKKRTSKRMSSFYCQAASIRIFLRRTPFPRPVNQRSVCRTKSEEQQNERTMSFYKKLVASDMTLATSCRVFTEKMQTCSHCSTMVFKINSVDMGTILRHQRLFHLVVRRQFWILNVHCQI